MTPSVSRQCIFIMRSTSSVSDALVSISAVNDALVSIMDALLQLEQCRYGVVRREGRCSARDQTTGAKSVIMLVCYAMKTPSGRSDQACPIPRAPQQLTPTSDMGSVITEAVSSIGNQSEIALCVNRRSGRGRPALRAEDQWRRAVVTRGHVRETRFRPKDTGLNKDSCPTEVEREACRKWNSTSWQSGTNIKHVRRRTL